MKKTLYLLFLLIFTTAMGSQLRAQSFNEGLELYRAEQFEEALSVLSNLQDDQSVLFIGKSHLALGNYHSTIAVLSPLHGNQNENLRSEAIYTTALAQFRLKQYDTSLDHLYRLIESQTRSSIRFDAQRLYRQILGYLAINERFETLQRSTNPAIRYDLVNQSKNIVDGNSYRALVRELIRMEPDSSLKNELSDLLKVDSDLIQFLNRYPSAPTGMVYHVGVVLPEFDEEDPDFTIPRNLYQGLIMAADEFNSRNSDKKIRLIFRNSHEHPDSTAEAITGLVWGHKIDAVVGPLFSEPAMRMAQLSEEYRVPMMAPLANSDELNLDFNYTFQLNPTFEIHGLNMARFAVQELGLDTLAVIVEKSSLGEAAASSFRREAEQLGANISYYISEDFASLGYDLSEFTKVFTPDSILIDSLGYKPTNGIYAPFTGQAAPTMSNLLLNDLEAMRSEVVVMGSGEWANANPSAFQSRFFEIYYSEAFGEAADTTAIRFFEEDYETRFGSPPDRFAKIGYDSGYYLFQSLETAGNPVYMGRALRTSPPYNGTALRIHFDGKRVNQNVFIRGLTPSANDRLMPAEKLPLQETDNNQ